MFEQEEDTNTVIDQVFTWWTDDEVTPDYAEEDYSGQDYYVN